MNNNRSNTRMIAIADDFVLNEEWSKEIDKASSPHLEMLKRFIESLNKNRVVDSDNFERDDIQASLSFEEIASHLPYNFVNERRA